MNRRILSGSKVNRDRRDQAYCRWVIAEAERRRREAEAAAREAVVEAECEHCGKASCAGDCPQYYEEIEDQAGEWNADDEVDRG
jgi:Fe-S-cluster-containing dehydrogenase component